MLRVAGACLILSASSLLGVQKSRQFTKRIEQLQELQRIVLLIQGEILYKNAALPEALRSSAGKVKVPFDSFLRQTAGRADAFDGVRFSDLFETEIKEQLKGTALTKEDKEEFARFGESLGYLDVEMQKNAMKLSIIKNMSSSEIGTNTLEYLQKEIPQKRKLYQSLGVMGGIFLLILLWQ